MRQNQKGFSEIIFILIVVVLIGVVGFFVSNNSGNSLVSQPNPTTEAMKKVDVSNWEFYASDEFGFNFKYPSSFDFFQELPLRAEDLDDNVPSTVLETASKEDDFRLRISIIKTDSTPQEWVENHDCPTVNGDPSCLAMKGSLLDSVQFQPINKEDSIVENPRFVSTYIRHQGHLYEFLSAKSSGTRSPVDEDTISLHNQIISTFEFTE